MKSILEKEISDFFKNAIPIDVPSSTTPNVSDDNSANQIESEIQNETENNEKEFYSFSHLNFWNLLTLIFIIGVLVFFLIQISKINDRINRRKITDVENTTNRFTQYDLSPKNVNKSDVERFIQNSDKISELNDAISQLQNRVSILESSSTAANQVIHKQQTPELYQTSADEVFYMMKPVDDYFPNSNKSYHKNDTVYKLTVKSNKTEALFEIHTGGAPVNDIAKRNEAYIKPACEEENMPGSTVYNIITKRKGVASLEGDKWVIKSKAVIRYE
jgi:hypothetical protein